MPLSAKVYVEDADLALVPTIQSVPEADIGVVADVGTNPQQDVYFFWIEAGDFDAVESALDADHTIAEFTKLIETSIRRTYRIRYSDEAKLISPAVAAQDGLIMDTRSQCRGWLLQVQLQNHEDLYNLHEYATEADIQFEIREINQEGRTDTQRSVDLTDSQIQVLVTAYEQGYYEERQETDLAELGDILGTSQAGVSSLLRRASGRLIEEMLGYDEHERT